MGSMRGKRKPILATLRPLRYRHSCVDKLPPQINNRPTGVIVYRQHSCTTINAIDLGCLVAKAPGKTAPALRAASLTLNPRTIWVKVM